MKIDVISNSELQKKISVTVERSDYEPKYNAELVKYKDKVQLKGFRKGKVPTSAVKKMYGKSILAEVVNNELQAGVSNYLQDNKVNILGSPLPSEDQELIDFDLADFQDYTFLFDIGLTPDFEVVGVTSNDSYTKYEINISDSIIDDELEHMRKKLGKTEETEDAIEENDIITIEAKEIQDGKVTSDSFETAFSVLVKDIADENIKTKVLAIKKKEDFLFDITKVEKNTSEKHIRKYLLNLDEGDDRVVGNSFLGQVTKISRLILAEYDQDFFDQGFGKDKVKSIEEAKAEIRTNIGAYFDTQATQLSYREIMESLMDKNDITLPEDFLKRLLKQSNENVSQEDVENEFPGFAKNLKWTLIKSNLSKKFDIKVEQEEIRAKIANKVRSYMSQYGMPDGQMDLGGIVDRYMENQKEVEKEYEEILADKIFEDISKQVTFISEEVTDEEFKDIVKKLNEKVA